MNIFLTTILFACVALSVVDSRRGAGRRGNFGSGPPHHKGGGPGGFHRRGFFRMCNNMTESETEVNECMESVKSCISQLKNFTETTQTTFSTAFTTCCVDGCAERPHKRGGGRENSAMCPTCAFKKILKLSKTGRGADIVECFGNETTICEDNAIQFDNLATFISGDTQITDAITSCREETFEGCDIGGVFKCLTNTCVELKMAITQPEETEET